MSKLKTSKNKAKESNRMIGKKPKRRFGLLKGKITVAKDFDETEFDLVLAEKVH